MATGCSTGAAMSWKLSVGICSWNALILLIFHTSLLFPAKKKRVKYQLVQNISILWIIIRVFLIQHHMKCHHISHTKLHNHLHILDKLHESLHKNVTFCCLLPIKSTLPFHVNPTSVTISLLIICPKNHSMRNILLMVPYREVNNFHLNSHVLLLWSTLSGWDRWRGHDLWPYGGRVLQVPRVTHLGWGGRGLILNTPRVSIRLQLGTSTVRQDPLRTRYKPLYTKWGRMSLFIRNSPLFCGIVHKL